MVTEQMQIRAYYKNRIRAKEAIRLLQLIHLDNSIEVRVYDNGIIQIIASNPDDRIKAILGAGAKDDPGPGRVTEYYTGSGLHRFRAGGHRYGE